MFFLIKIRKEKLGKILKLPEKTFKPFCQLLQLTAEIGDCNNQLNKSMLSEVFKPWGS